jgi:hypothetical protein
VRERFAEYHELLAADETLTLVNFLVIARILPEITSWMRLNMPDAAKMHLHHLPPAAPVYRR